jgi:hypothetical protein
VQPIGRGTRTSGKWTGLGIAQQFSNAAVHFLREHSLAKSHKNGGTELPIDQGVWRDILDEGFGRNVRQTLAAYCKYYNDGVHGHGYDRDGTWDCGTGNRAVEQVKGRSINGTRNGMSFRGQSAAATDESRRGTDAAGSHPCLIRVPSVAPKGKRRLVHHPFIARERRAMV